MKTFRDLLNEYLGESIKDWSLDSSFFKNIAKDPKWTGGVIDFSTLNVTPDIPVEIPCAVCGTKIMSDAACPVCALKPNPFKKGDIIKPIKGSRIDPEHWRYVIVHVRPDGLDVLDFHNNTNWIGIKHVHELELIQDKDMSDLVEDVLSGREDNRF